MRQVVLTTGEFTTEDEAIALAEKAGLVPLALDLESSGIDHWHDFGATVYIVDGSVRITDVESGSSYELRAGCSVKADSGAVHREEGEPYRAVVAFDRDPATLTTPIDKDPADRPASIERGVAPVSDSPVRGRRRVYGAVNAAPSPVGRASSVEV